MDVTSAPNLTGRSILIVEDDYSLAADIASALRGAGAKVLGPCANEEASYRQIDSVLPTAALLDLSLGGGGPRFEIAYKLLRRGVPFAFLTGYDPEVVPDDLKTVPLLRKPVAAEDILDAVSRL